MFSLQFLSMRKVYDPVMIPKKYDYQRCCQIIHPEEAIRHGHLECLKYIHIYSCPWDNRVYKIAEENGNIDCMK